MPYINGVWMPIPGTNVTINDSNFTGATNTTGLGIIFIGPVTDGQPNTQLQFSTPAQAQQTLKGGDGLQAVLNAFAGAGSVGLKPITFIRPEQAMQGSSTINSSTSTAQIALETISYGTLANDAKWMVQAGSSQGYKVSQAFDFVGPAGQTYAPNTQDNISLPVLSLYYTGSGTSPTVTITDTAFQVSATVGGTATQIANIALSSTVTVQQLVNQLNQISGLVANVLDPNAQDATGALFDNVSAATLSITSTTPTTLYANVTAVVRWFNQQNAYFTATRQANATSLATSSTWTYASGGTTPTAANSDWQNAYTTAQSIVGVSLIAPVSSSESLWVMNDTHCQYMTAQGQPRRGYVGDGLSQTIATETAYASEINSNRTTIVWPEQQGVDYNGNPTTFPPYLVAAQIMGMRAATSPTQALTLNVVKSNGMGQTVAPPTAQQGINGGVCVLYTNPNGQVVIGQDRTTWLQNDAYDKVENSTGLVADLISQDLNNTLQTYNGQPVTAITVGAAQAALVSRLLYWYDLGYLASQPQSTDVTLTGSGDQITGTAQAAFDVPANYIQLSLTPTTVSVSA